MNKTILSIATTAAMLLSGCSVITGKSITPSQERIKKEYQLQPFERIEAATGISVVYTQSNGGQEVVLDAPENVAEAVNVEVRGGTLDVSFNNVRINGDHKTTLYVSSPSVHTFKASSAGSIHLSNGLTYGGEVVVKSSSAGSIHAEQPIKAGSLYAEASSAGSIELNGAETGRLNIEASSAGGTTVRGIKADAIHANASSAGSITLEGTCKKFDGKASIAGSINHGHLEKQGL